MVAVLTLTLISEDGSTETVSEVKTVKTVDRTVDDVIADVCGYTWNELDGDRLQYTLTDPMRHDSEEYYSRIGRALRNE